MKKVISLVAMASILINMGMSTNLSYAESKSSLSSKLSRNREEQEELDVKIKNLDSQIKEIEANIKNTEEKIKSLNLETENTKKEIENLTSTIKENEELLGQRLKVIDNNYSMGYIKVILSSKSLSEFFNNMFMVKEVIEQDRELLTQLENDKNIVEKKKLELDDKIKEQELLKISLESDNKKIEEDRAEVKKLKLELEKEEDNLENEISKIIAKEQASIQSSNNSSGGSSSNAVITNGSWPVPGYRSVSSAYGYRIHPVLGIKKFHTGIDIPAPKGTPVTSFDDGTVIYSGVQGSYGNTVMVKHSNGVVTLYAHNSALTVSVGQKVKKGQVIAKIGTTGRSTGNHLHFEVRVNGQHTNPMNYL